MYLVIREETDNNTMQICFVQAETAEKAKERVGVPSASSKWIVLPLDVLNQLENAKEGYIVKQV